MRAAAFASGPQVAAKTLTGRNPRAFSEPADSEAVMRKKVVVFCEVCGGAAPSGAADFLVFHCLAFCSPDCRDEYRSADEERRVAKDAPRSTTRKPTRQSRAA
jgi:hypothetical protein